jgi:hypothetical protein
VRSDSEIYVRIGVHNGYFEILTGLGLFGMIAYLAVLYSAFKQLVLGMKAKWDEHNEWISHFSFYLILSILAAMINSLFADYHFNYLLWVPLAGAFAAGSIRARYCHSSK